MKTKKDHYGNSDLYNENYIAQDNREFLSLKQGYSGKLELLIGGAIMLFIAITATMPNLFVA